VIKQFFFQRRLSWNDASNICLHHNQRLLEPIISFHYDLFPLKKEGHEFIEKYGHSGLGDIIFIGVSKLPQVSGKTPTREIITLFFNSDNMQFNIYVLGKHL